MARKKKKNKKKIKRVRSKKKTRLKIKSRRKTKKPKRKAKKKAKKFHQKILTQSKDSDGNSIVKVSDSWANQAYVNESKYKKNINYQ